MMALFVLRGELSTEPDTDWSWESLPRRPNAKPFIALGVCPLIGQRMGDRDACFVW